MSGIMKNSSFAFVCGLATAGLLCGASSLFAADVSDAAKPFVGRWALTLPGGGAGWLGVEPQADGTLKGAVLWGGGSVVPVNETKVENGALVVVRKHNRKKDGKDVQNVETITAKLDGDKLALATRTVNDEGKEVGKAEFAGKKIPELPPRPDLSKIKFGTPIPLLNGKDLAGWKVMNEKATCPELRMPGILGDVPKIVIRRVDDVHSEPVELIEPLRPGNLACLVVRRCGEPENADEQFAGWARHTADP